MKAPAQYIIHKQEEGLVCLNRDVDVDFRTGRVLGRFFINHSSLLLCGSNIVYIHYPAHRVRSGE